MERPRCPTCGRGDVVRVRKAGRTEVYRCALLEIPADVAIPTCSACGKYWFDPEAEREFLTAMARLHREWMTTLPPWRGIRHIRVLDRDPRPALAMEEAEHLRGWQRAHWCGRGAIDDRLVLVPYASHRALPDGGRSFEEWQLKICPRCKSERSLVCPEISIELQVEHWVDRWGHEGTLAASVCEIGWFGYAVTSLVALDSEMAKQLTAARAQSIEAFIFLREQVCRPKPDAAALLGLTVEELAAMEDRTRPDVDRPWELLWKLAFERFGPPTRPARRADPRGRRLLPP